MKNSVLNAAMRLLKYRHRSCHEIKNRLIQKGYSEDDILNTVNHLISLGYLNDEYFANIYVLDKLKQNGVGPIYLQIELKKHEIPQLVIDDAIASGYNKISSKDIINNHIQKRLKLLRHNSINDKKRKIVQFLKRKGFTWDQISLELKNYFTD